MPAFTLDPLKDSRWSEFLATHPRASVFHGLPWLDALRRTYSYQPVVYTSAAPGEPLRDGIVFCRVESWLTGRRLVSLPFSDHCDPLLGDTEKAKDLFAAIREDAVGQRWAYVEVRPLEPLDSRALALSEYESYLFHELDLTPSIDKLFDGFHKDCVQRKITRASREGLTYSEGRSETLLAQFYKLLLITRLRHRLPPQPLAWYRNLIECFGDALKIRVAYKDELPVASILTLQSGDALVFKYGCADPIANKLGGTQMLLWKSIQEAKANGLRVFDLGRSETSNTGLVTFKERWGATGSRLTYWKYAGTGSGPAWINFEKKTSLMMRLARRILDHAPSRLLSAVGTLGYRHVG